jgi:hypothetical protein
MVALSLQAHQILIQKTGAEFLVTLLECGIIAGSSIVTRSRVITSSRHVGVIELYVVHKHW